MEPDEIEKVKETLKELGQRCYLVRQAITNLEDGGALGLAPEILALDDCLSRARIHLQVFAMALSLDDDSPLKRAWTEDMGGGRTLIELFNDGRKEWEEAWKSFGQELVQEYRK